MASPSVTHRVFGTMPDGEAVEQYSLRYGELQLDAITLGAIITSLRAPDRHGTSGDVVLAHAELEPYLANSPYLGAIVGRYANRIAQGRFDLDGVTYQLGINDGPNHLHGGVRGFDRHTWSASPIGASGMVGVRFERTSPAGEEGYPGTLRISVSYMLTSRNTVLLEYEATTDAPTIVNVTQHTYFNLAGETSTSVLDHELRMAADRFLPVDSTLIPTGEFAGVSGTAFDFRTPTRIASRMSLDDEQLRRGRGFDHTFVLAAAGAGGRDLLDAAELRDPHSGRRLAIATTEPGVQFYSGQLLDGRTQSAYGRMLRSHAGLCLETQHFPDTPNQPFLPSVTLRPGGRYLTTTRWVFTAD